MLGHGHAEKTVHAGHGNRVMGNNHEFRIRRGGHFVHQIAKPFDVVVIKRGVYLV